VSSNYQKLITTRNWNAELKLWLMILNMRPIDHCGHLLPYTDSTVYELIHRHTGLQWHALSLITNKWIVCWMYCSSDDSFDSCKLWNNIFFLISKITREMESVRDTHLEETIYYYLLWSRQIQAYFGPPSKNFLESPSYLGESLRQPSHNFEICSFG